MTADNPYLLDRPAVVSFSGGRTSGYLLWHVLQAFGGTLPADVKVLFANTGKERPETLDFVERCAQRWGVGVVWLEYRYEPGEAGAAGRHAFAVVDYATASRDGAPFAQVIGARGFLPNPVARFCTVELKIRTADRYLRSLGWTGWTNAIGLRADEPRRVARLRGANRHAREDPVAPLHTAGVTLAGVNAFWAAQPFGLGLMPHEGNCDLCFLKGRDRVVRIMHEHPDLAAWWVEQERSIKLSDSARNASFRADRPRYESLLKQATEQPLFDWGDEPLSDCHCTD